MDRPGGVQTHIRDTAAALGELGHRVTIIAPNVGEGRHRERPSPNVRVLKLGRALAIQLSGTKFETSLAVGYQHRRLRATMRRGDFDVVHYHSPWTPLLPFQVSTCSAGARIVTFHDTPPDTVGGAVSRAILAAASRLLLPHVDGAIAVSEAPRAHLRPRPGQKIWLAPPCTDLRRFEQTPLNTSSVGDPVTILFVGRLEPRKGAMLLLESYRRLRLEGLPVRLVIAGSGGEEPALRRFAERQQLADVHFIGRFEDADAPALYASADIFCAPSPYGESFGIVIAEAMASGRPVVAAANRGYSTILHDHGAELLAAPGDAHSLYLRLRGLVVDPSLRARFAVWGRADARKYDCRSVAPMLAELYRQAIAAASCRVGAPPPVVEGRAVEAFADAA